MTAPLPSPAEVAQMRERHVDYWEGKCRGCGRRFPCDAARLLALVDNQRVTLDEDALHMAEQRRRVESLTARLDAVAAEYDALAARLGAVLAECDEQQGWWRNDLDRIRRAATGAAPRTPHDR